MLIVSEFHDYYDSVSALGIDKQCPYQRKEIQLDLDPSRDLVKPSHSGTYHSRQFNYEVKYRLVGFCGNIYPLAFVEKKWSAELKETTFFYDEEKLLSYLTREEVKFKQYRGWWWRKSHSLETIDGLKSHFNPKTWDHFLPYFQQHKTPVFLIGSKHLVLNNSLKKFKFQQIKDPFSAFQDIYMFISGVLGVETKPTVEISDKVMAASKGHDGEYSFRKPPGKRGKKRWR